MKPEQATPQQREAIISAEEKILALAGPGSGKTATLAARIKHWIEEGEEPQEFCVVTFTNAGARELESRLTVKAHENGDESVPPIDAEIELGYIGTLHGLALLMLEEHGGPYGYGSRLAMISPEASADLLESKAKSMGCKVPFKDLLELKGAGLPPPDGTFNIAHVVIRTYLADMRAAGVVDFDLLLQEFDRLLREQPEFRAEIGKRFTYLFVDEVQDSAPLDWSIYRAFPSLYKFLVGDPDQAIYAFRGGRVAELIAFAQEKDVQVIYLEENFRSDKAVCDAAQRLIECNHTRVKKRTRSVRGAAGGEVVFHTDLIEGEELAIVARGINNAGPVTVAVLARTNAIADKFRRELPGCGITVAEVKRAELPQDWRMARAFVEVCTDPENDAVAFFYVAARAEAQGLSAAAARAHAHKIRVRAAAAGQSINAHALKLGRIPTPEIALEALASFACRETRGIVADKIRELGRAASMMELTLALAEVREYSKEEDGPGVRVLTMHAAKGREFDVVFIVGFEDEVIPGRAAKDGPEAIEEERRLAYVALTRARYAVYITSCVARSSKWSPGEKHSISRFAHEISPSYDDL